MNDGKCTAPNCLSFILHPSSFIIPLCLPLAEIALVFAVFFVQGAVPVPDVNEPYYLGKAIHFWNPDWARGDFFLESKDTHLVFYVTFGWLSLWLKPLVLAWFGRVLTWVLLAWAWRRLSMAVVPRPWFSVASAALLVGLTEHCHMAGEWIIGGVEAKGFAFVLVFLGLEAFVLGRWNRAWLLLGAASAFHVLVGGWSVVAVGLAWLGIGRSRPGLRSMWPAILGGFVLSLAGLVPALALNWGTGRDVVREANQIYVYGRLGHHLNLAQIPDEYVFRFVLLLVLWLVLSVKMPADAPLRRLRAFVAAAVVIALAGAAISLLAPYDRARAAGLLRFYWFRLADVAVPMGIALGAVSFVTRALHSRPATGRCWMALVILMAGIHVGLHAARLPLLTPPPADRQQHYGGWRLACEWVARSGEIPPEARFITPRSAHTFKWYAGRAEVANWKEIPQDAAAMGEWWQRLGDLSPPGENLPDQRTYKMLPELGADRLRQLGAKYEADFVLTVVTEPLLPLEVVYKNRTYVIYKMIRCSSQPTVVR
jgi:hypothetical protein